MFVGLYEDAAAVAEMQEAEAMEELKMEALALEAQMAGPVPVGLEGLLDVLAAQVVAARPVKAGRKGRGNALSEARRLLAEGKFPVPPAITSEANISYQKRIDAMVAVARDATLLVSERVWALEGDHKVKGVNTYAKLVEGYRLLLVDWLMRQADQVDAVVEPPAEVAAQADALVKVADAAKAQADALIATAVAKAKKAPAKKIGSAKAKKGAA